MKKNLFVLLAFGLGIVACTDNTIVQPSSPDVSIKPILPNTPYDYGNLSLPAGAQIASNFFQDINGNLTNSQQVTDHGATLGRVLFYDKNLSLNNKVACGTCHHQDKAFADGKKFSEGFEGRLTTRNSMAIVNPITQNNLFWDSRSKSISDLSLKPVQNHIEMGMENIGDLVTKLQNVPYYKELFRNAYGTEVISDKMISKALSEFVGSITSNRAKIDLVNSSDIKSAFTDLELKGKEIFDSERAKCGSCHGGGTMSAQDGPNDPYGSGGGSIGGASVDMQGATNIGLDLVYRDNGVGNGRFKIPTLRNVALTAPYMHDGRFESLDEVVEHYSSGIKPHKSLDPKFKDAHGNLVQMNLNGIEKKALVAFLHTLTDIEMTTDPKWSDPFKK